MPPRRYRRNARGRFVKPRGRAWGKRFAYAGAGYAAYGARRAYQYYKGKAARPKARGRMGNAVAFFGMRNIAKRAPNKISKKKSEQYTIDINATDAPAVFPGLFGRVTPTLVAQDMSLAGFSRAPLRGLQTGAYGTIREGWSWNETFHKWHLCVSAPDGQLSTCNRIVLLAIKDHHLANRLDPNTYQWQDFFQTGSVTSFYNSKENSADATRRMTPYKVILDRSMVLNDQTVQNDKLVNFNIPKTTYTVLLTGQDADTSPQYEKFQTRYLLWMVTDAGTDDARPTFTGEIRMKYQDP